MLFSTILQTGVTELADTTAKVAPILTETIEKLSNMETKEIISLLIEHAISIGLKILAAIVIYSAGAWLIQRIKKVVKRLLVKKNADASLTSFIMSFTSISLTVILIVITVQALGVDTSSLVALLAGSGLAVGMALSGSLQNFAGGIMILLFKPFKVGDYIETLGYAGTVSSIQITTTVIKTADNKTVILPNSSLSSGTINNYSTSPTRRCDWDISVEYGCDIDNAKEVFLEIINSHPKVKQEPVAPFVALKSLDNSALIITGRGWVDKDDYWTVFFEINETIYKEFPKHGINFPFPQLDVHIKNNN